jgi:type IV secretory pathway VirB3-like protein
VIALPNIFLLLERPPLLYGVAVPAKAAVTLMMMILFFVFECLQVRTT